MTQKQIQFIFRISVFFIFIGRAWQHLFWDAPYRSFFWDESILKPIVEGLSDMSWQEYATSLSVNDFIQSLIVTNGYIYLIAAICTLLIRENNFKWLRIPIYIGGVSLVILAVLLTKEKFYHTAQFFEHSIQFGLPFVFLYNYRQNVSTKTIIKYLKILIAVTFFSHGLYAFGFYQVPGNFIDMLIQIFGISESVAILLLYIAGIIDFVIAVLIFIPRVQKYALWYAFIWGMLTAFARIVANFDIDFFFQSIHQNLYEVIYRLPHGLVPLLVILLQKYKSYIFKK